MTHRTAKGRARAAPVSVRMTPEERAELKRLANSQTLSRYIRNWLFNRLKNDGEPNGTDNRLSPQVRQQSLAQILTLLGRAQIGQSLHDLGEAARLGTLPLTPEIIAEIRKACAHIREIRELLFHGLGLNPKEKE